MMNKWNIYEILRGNCPFIISEIEQMNNNELKEGVIEYLITLKHEERNGKI
jgi:hypothetical protein